MMGEAFDAVNCYLLVLFLSISQLSVLFHVIFYLGDERNQ